MTIGRLVAYVTNISSYSKHYRKHAVIHSEVNANVLNRFILKLSFLASLSYKYSGDGGLRKDIQDVPKGILQ
jgi:hypothetical protein